MNIKIDIADLHYILSKTPANQNIMLAGRHGIGKSEILTQYFAKRGMNVIALFLGQMSDPGDLIGLPDKSGEKTVFRPPYWFPLDGKPIVLFLDELNRARPEVLQTIMDLALNRKLAGRELPAGSRIIAAVNEGEEYQLTDLDPALVSRFNIFRFEPSVSEWLLWAKANKLDYRVINFITENQQWLDKDPNMNENEDMGLDKTPDRRAWKRVSDILIDTDRITDKDIKLIASIIGVKAANLFVTKMNANKKVTGKELLHDFDACVAGLDRLKTHDFALLNEDIFQYLQITDIAADKIDAVKSNIVKYVDYLKTSKRGEVLASFSSQVSGGKYTKAYRFFLQHCNDIILDLMDYVTSIH